jgi:hypothetical protein
MERDALVRGNIRLQKKLAVTMPYPEYAEVKSTIASNTHRLSEIKSELRRLGAGKSIDARALEIVVCRALCSCDTTSSMLTEHKETCNAKVQYVSAREQAEVELGFRQSAEDLETKDRILP